jgi:GNAT superfamily N-acetyltransferase
MSVIPKSASYFEIEDFYLVPNYRNKGIGTIFFEYMEQQLKMKVWNTFC